MEKKGKGKIGRGPFEQFVEDFCSAPRGGVKKKIGRGPIEQRVGDFCSVPRGGWERKKGNRSRTDRAVGRGLLLCAKERREKKNKQKKIKTKGKHEISGRGPIGRCVEKFSPVPRGGVERKTKNRSGTTCAMSFLFALCRVVA